ncbi:MAG: hypothetical protein UHX00_13575 [Caryophanon sp.]|nr:hypothetical protein [Caryophanon sp.]
MADVERVTKKGQRTKRIFNTYKTMKTENIDEAVTLLNEYLMLNEIYQGASKINAEICELACRYNKAKCDAERMSIANEMDTKINRIFVANKYINLSVKCDIYLYGFCQAFHRLESKIEILKQQIEKL